MSTTVQDIFEAAMVLMDNTDDTGETDTDDNEEYKLKTAAVLNVLLYECYVASDAYAPGEEGKRSVPAAVSAPGDEVALDEGVCRSVLPYGLAAHFLKAEGSAELAAYFEGRYREGLALCRAAVPAQSEDITAVYGGIGFGEDACL